MTRFKKLAVASAVVTGMLVSADFISISPTLSAADTNAYFDALITRAGFWKGYSLRPRTLKSLRGGRRNPAPGHKGFTPVSPDFELAKVCLSA